MPSSEELDSEIEVINSIYGEGTLISDSDDIHILNLPEQTGAGPSSLRLSFPADYPDSPPVVLGTQSSGEHKGDAARSVGMVREIIAKVFVKGEVCLFSVIDEAVQSQSQAQSQLLGEAGSSGPGMELESEALERGNPFGGNDTQEQAEHADARLGPQPPWILSDVITEKKSIFVARAARVSSVREAEGFLGHLMATDKKVARATHSITAWRITGENGVSFQDCDDDGETAAGGRLLHLMQLMEVWDVIVVVTRWYGGIQLGPDRFRIINSVARDALVKGGYYQEESWHTSKRKGKK